MTRRQGSKSFHLALSERLADWYEKNKRDFPWRKTRDPYAILVCESMLQQTQADRVIAYYVRWMDRFPSFAALAKATEEEILEVWQGLGYYARARNLHKISQILRDNGLATLPADAEFLRELPGLGSYTTGALCSIAFNLPIPAIDGNVRRVFSRLLDMDSDPSVSKNSALIFSHLEAILKLGEPRLLSQAFMELGALICTPGVFPKCSVCPVSSSCCAFSAGTQGIRPVFAKKSRIKRRAGAAILIGTPEKGFILRRRPAGGLWARFYEIPWLVGDEGESAESCFKRLANQLGLPECVDTQMEETLKFTNWQVQVRLWKCEAFSSDEFLEKIPEGILEAVFPTVIKNLPMPAGLKRLVLRGIASADAKISTDKV